jgi:hypothetical protein
MKKIESNGNFRSYLRDFVSDFDWHFSMRVDGIDDETTITCEKISIATNSGKHAQMNEWIV